MRIEKAFNVPIQNSVDDPGEIPVKAEKDSLSALVAYLSRTHVTCHPPKIVSMSRVR